MSKFSTFFIQFNRADEVEKLESVLEKDKSKIIEKESEKQRLLLTFKNEDIQNELINNINDYQ